MSFVTAAPEFVTAAAGDLADIGSALGAANAVAALPTTGIAAAAADEVSPQIAALFGAYAQKYQALSAQSAAFHNEFVSLLNGSALTYLSTELTNAEQTLMNTVTGAAGSGAATAATLPLLGGGSGILGGLSPVVGGGPSGPILNGFSAELGGVLSNILNNGSPEPCRPAWPACHDSSPTRPFARRLPFPTVPIVVRLPFDGLLVPPQSITATVDVTAGPVTVPININLGGTEFGGLVPALVNYVPEQLASAITPK
jgi:hypothetical protein